MVSNRELSRRIKGAALAISAGMFALLAVLVFDIWRSGALDSPALRVNPFSLFLPGVMRRLVE